MTLAARFREVLAYNPENGDLVWRVATSFRVRVGDVAGCLSKAHGYISIRIDGALYQAHRVIWCMETGDWPTGIIDHKNGCRADNRWTNLRDVPRVVNQQNMRRAMSSSTTGLLGVSRHRDRFSATIKVNGKKIYLGTFDTAELAHQAYLTHKRALHPGNTL